MMSPRLQSIQMTLVCVTFQRGLYAGLDFGVSWILSGMSASPDVSAI